jgi:ligand-binding sensor domain-containing protein/signal transduction histidine kinase
MKWGRAHYSRVLAWCLLLCIFTAAVAEELPLRVYTTSDGLLRNRPSKIVRDSHGYLWFATGEGLSIFDGYQFTNYTTDDGLPNRLVSDVLETQAGAYWIATYSGMCRYSPKASAGAERFVCYRVGHSKESNQINALIEGRDHSIWIGTDDGLWRLNHDSEKSEAQAIALPWPVNEGRQVNALLEDRDGTLWVGAENGLYARWPSGDATRLNKAAGIPAIIVRSLLQDSQGRIWAGTHFALLAVASDRAIKRIVAHLYWKKITIAVFQTSDGKLWVGGVGLFHFQPEAAAPRDMVRSVATSLEEGFVSSMAEDLDHNLWVVSDALGVSKFIRHGFSSFGSADGLKGVRIHALTTSSHGDLYVVAGLNNHTIHRFDGKHFVSVDPWIPAGYSFAWGETQIAFEDHMGEWWVPGQGLLRYAAAAHLADLATHPPKATYTMKQGLPADVVLRIFEDSRGDIWVGCFEGLARWQRRDDRIQAFTEKEVLGDASARPPRMVTPYFFTEDTHGSIWIGMFPFGLARFHDGRFDFFSAANGLPPGRISGLYVDHLGRLWVASSQGGASRVDDTQADRPIFHTYTTAQGLSSNQVFSIAEDQSGLLYLSGGRGVDRLDVATGTIRRFPLGEGLPTYEVHQILRDKTGALWFGSGYGLSRYIPEPESLRPPQSPLIRRLSIQGKAFPVSDLGESTLSGLALAPGQNNLRIEFASLHFSFGEVLRYQYRLEGADKDWSPLTDQRTVNYANLAPRSYRFEVRAVNGDGLFSATNAAVSFTVLPPFWRRWWFLAFSLAMTVSILYAAYRYRLKQVVAIERIRTRLASDLHDDIGSGLVEIAIASELAKTPQASGTELLQVVGDRARQLRDSISDIVWSVDPRHDYLGDLVARIRQNTFSLLECNGRQVEFHAPEDHAVLGTWLAADRKRHLLLVCKEALTNVARHAGASRISVVLSLHKGTLTLEVRDNGRGFNPEVAYAGLGLRSMKRRSREVGGNLIVESAPGRGTRLVFSLPLS